MTVLNSNLRLARNVFTQTSLCSARRAVLVCPLAKLPGTEMKGDRSVLQGNMFSDSVCEWVARKNDHAIDPFAHLGELPSPAAQGIGAATASSAGMIVAKSYRIQKANNRVYIPVQDCNASLFILSEKRWR